MKLLLDSSALAKRYKREAGHDAVERLLMKADAVVLAAHCKTEIASSLYREVRDRAIDMAQYAHAMAEVGQDFVDFDIHAIGAETEAFAMAAMERSRLRAMDALHIGAAQAARVDVFVTADRKQAAAAQAAGLRIELVEA
ncbi:type II toxin-antitoxin system VapC family toxin [Ramlibacter sp. H39-3-26]|uniref:type II toxin-antitoxin system VapC family toxin n=1 Tax=Curvibacter soli TaxID=3031331 RepID=UPI0023DA17C6|nr:type II toxin-antitoxin system VapC family toxin [Ramlibacter sp. H39-3-26]MDF1485592.1 type II toxin-antitoxin system VapC family toxin [Ramlibacter sp. H39-3-26]